MIVYTLGVAVAGIAWLPLAVVGFGGIVKLSLPVFIWGCMLSGFVANFLGMQTPRH
jgi:hypothetical protein